MEGEERCPASWARLSHEQSPFSEVNLGNVNKLESTQKKWGAALFKKESPVPLQSHGLGLSQPRSSDSHPRPTGREGTEPLIKTTWRAHTRESDDCGQTNLGETNSRPRVKMVIPNGVGMWILNDLGIAKTFLIPSLPICTLFLKRFYCNIVDLHCCVSFGCTAQLISYTYTYSHSCFGGVSYISHWRVLRRVSWATQQVL